MSHYQITIHFSGDELETDGEDSDSDLPDNEETRDIGIECTELDNV